MLVIFADQPAAGDAGEGGVFERKHFPTRFDIYEAELSILRKREYVLAVVNAVLIVINKRDANLTTIVDNSGVDAAVRILLIDENQVEVGECVGIQRVCIHPAILIRKDLASVFVDKAPLIAVFSVESDLGVGIPVILVQIAVTGRFNDTVYAVSRLPIAGVELLVHGDGLQSPQYHARIVGVALGRLYIFRHSLSFLLFELPYRFIHGGFEIRIVFAQFAQLDYLFFQRLDGLRDALVQLFL